MSGFENFIGLNPWTALFTLCNLVIVYLILKKFLFKPVNKMIDDRQKEIDDLYAGAEAAQAEANALKQDYDQRLAQAKESSAAIIRDATQEAGRRSEEMLRQARTEADALREKASADIALDIAEKVVERELDEKDQERLIEGFLRDMGDQL